MSSPAWDAEQKAKAEKEKLFLFKMQLQGKHADRGSFGVSGTATPKHALALQILASDENLADAVIEAAEKRGG